MKILVTDTSNSTCCAGIYDDGRELSYEISFEKKTHSETFMPLVERVIGKSGISMSDIDAIAAVTGPGSFTGIRIGLSAVKGMALGMGVRCIPVSSLKALAASVENITYPKEQTVLVPCFDARNKRVFGCALSEDGLGEVVPEGAYAADDLAEKIVRAIDTTNHFLIVIGDGAGVMKETFETLGVKAQYAPGCAISPRGIYEASIGTEPVSGEALKASYLAVSSAERLKRS